MAVGSDSASYLAALQSLTQGNGLLSATAERLVLWPPGYPVFLWLVSGFGKWDGLEAARWGNVLLLGSMVFAVGAFVSRRVGWKSGAVASLVFCLLEALHFVATFALSELLFCALILAHLFSLDSYIRRPTLARALWSGVLAALSVLVRYVGVFPWLCGVGLAWVFTSRLRKQRHLHVFAHAAPAVLAIGWWLLRNWLNDGRLSGERGLAGPGLAENLRLALTQMGNFILPANAFLAQQLGLITLALTAWMVGGRCLRLPQGADFGAGEGASERLWGNLALIQWAFYAAGIVLLASLVSFDPLGMRLMAPAAVGLGLWMVALGVSLSRAQGRLGRAFYRLGLLLLMGWCLLAGSKQVQLFQSPRAPMGADYMLSAAERERLQQVRSERCGPGLLITPLHLEMFFAAGEPVLTLSQSKGRVTPGDCVLLHRSNSNDGALRRFLSRGSGELLFESEAILLFRVEQPWSAERRVGGLF